MAPIMQYDKQVHTLSDQIRQLENLCLQLEDADDLTIKLHLLKSHANSEQLLKAYPRLQSYLETANITAQFTIHAVLAVGQGPVVFQELDDVDDFKGTMQALIEVLEALEKSYDAFGGIVGYHLAVLKLIAGGTADNNKSSDTSIWYDEPEGLNCSIDTREVRKAVRWGLENMPEIAEIYPIGGAGDRLNLKEETTGEPLPAAQLQFCGRTLLEGLIRDLQGREYLYYKLFGVQLVTPVTAMTSQEKNNHQHILNICQQLGWFGRPKDSFAFFIQHQVPMVTKSGMWAMQAPLKPILKPGGHGVIWKLAEVNGIFDWLNKSKRYKALVRQINNPMAGVDNGLLTLMGLGAHHKKSFGFASCERLLSAAEGMNVLCEKVVDEGYEYSITNVEYTEFERCGIKDSPSQAGSPYSRFPANTNILYVDLQAIRKALKHCSIPGMLINMKSDFPCYVGEGKVVQQKAGRLESTMQNIADWIVDRFPKRLEKGNRDNLHTFITYNDRRKTISVAKQLYDINKPSVDTPEECFYDLMRNYIDLLSKYCHMQVPAVCSKAEYFLKGPTLTVLFHPALGGLYSVIGQKIRGGTLSVGSEWIMEIAEAQIVDLDLSGSLLIEADDIMGGKDANGCICYSSEKAGKCTLINVTVRNKGLAEHSPFKAWKRQENRHEALHIVLRGNAEFFAENVIFEGNMTFEVADGYRLVVSQNDSKLITKLEKIEGATWKWGYSFDQEDQICLQVIRNKIGKFA